MMHASRPRNRLIALALYDRGVIEHYGRGIKRIKEECDRNGNPYPDWTDRPGEFLTIYKTRGSQETEVGGKAPEVGGVDFDLALSGVRKDFRETCRRVWELLSKDEGILQQDICARLQIADSSVRNAYAALKDAGLLIKTGEGRGSKWTVVRGKSSQD